MSETRKGKIFADWWQESLANRASGRAKALRSKLRRADNEVSVLAEPEVHELARRLGLIAGQRWKVRAFCAMVKALSHVETDIDRRAAQLFGMRKTAEEKRLLSTLRFQRIVRSANSHEAVAGIIRGLSLIGRACDVDQLGRDMYNWSESVRNRWCFDYFEGVSVPNEPDEGRNEA